MKRFVFWALVITCSLGALVLAEDFKANRSDRKVEDRKDEMAPEIKGVHWARDFNVFRHSSNPNMTYHGGKILSTVHSTAIWWGTSWTKSNYKIAGIDAFYSGHNGSHYAATVDEYTGTNGTVGNALVHNGSIVDNSPASGGNNASVILGEVCKVITSLDQSGNGYYPVYSDEKRGNAGYCAWHSAGSCSGVPVQFAFFFNLDNDPGCDPGDTQTGNPQGLAALANVSAHEISEARSDPSSPGAWYDSAGNENGDKCAWTFNVPFVTFPDGHNWKLQGEWSNAAYTAGTGYPNSQGQKGCLDGH
jgi:hypothetical protein